jgi:hypothetical protein
MQRFLMVLAALAFVHGPAWARPQEDEDPVDPCQELESFQKAQEDLRRLREPSEASPDLWYGTPDVRPGGDLLGPILDLVRNPSGLLDFKPRKVRSGLPDRETAEFLRERR